MLLQIKFMKKTNCINLVNLIALNVKNKLKFIQNYKILIKFLFFLFVGPGFKILNKIKCNALNIFKITT